jgi:hypothetical protein
MTSKNVYLTALALALVVATAFWHLEAPDDAAAGAGAVAAALPAARGTPQAAQPAPAATPAPQEQAPPKPATLGKFNSARSYRAFIYEAARDRLDGGIVYTVEAINGCIDAVVPGHAPEPKDQRQRDAMTTLRGRCDMSHEELSAIGRANERTRQAHGDPLFTIAEAMRAAKTPEARRVAVGALLQTQDPAALGALGRHFMGREHAIDSAAGFDYALRLAQCDLGLDCGPDALPTLQLCIRNNWCAASYRDALRIGLGEAPFAQAAALAAQLVTQIRRQNGAAFVSGT